MGKLFLILFLVLAGLGAAWAAGYRLHTENISYYLKLEGGGERKEITFRDGKTLTGVVVEETADHLKVDSEGAAMIFSRAEIQFVKSVSSANPATLFMENYKKYKKIHPLVTHEKTQSFGSKIDEMIMEPSRIADEIRKKNPQITSAGQISAMMEAARDAQSQAKSAQARAIAKMDEMSR